MNKLAGAYVVFAFVIFASPAGSQQEMKPREVSAFDALDQLQRLIQMDETDRRPASDTLAVVKQIVQLNGMQINQYGLKATMADRFDGPGFVVDSQKVAFKELRDSICRERPNMKIVSLDGWPETCR